MLSCFLSFLVSVSVVKNYKMRTPCEEGNLPIPCESLYILMSRNLMGSELKRLHEEVLKNLKVKEEEATYLPQATIEQLQSLTWHKY